MRIAASCFVLVFSGCFLACSGPTGTDAGIDRDSGAPVECVIVDAGPGSGSDAGVDAGVLCGNGRVDFGEECDWASGNSDTFADRCRTTCVSAHCGDGVVDMGEACDDGAANSDTVANACRTTCVRAHCGDSVIDLGEACDNGAANSDTAADACRTTCVPARCGDGAQDTGEACDNGAANNDLLPDACRTRCVLPSCGDEVTDSTETCDDGNDVPGDGCRACAREQPCVLVYEGDVEPNTLSLTVRKIDPTSHVLLDAGVVALPSEVAAPPVYGSPLTTCGPHVYVINRQFGQLVHTSFADDGSLSSTDSIDFASGLSLACDTATHTLHTLRRNDGGIDYVPFFVAADGSLDAGTPVSTSLPAEGTVALSSVNVVPSRGVWVTSGATTDGTTVSSGYAFLSFDGDAGVYRERFSATPTDRVVMRVATRGPSVALAYLSNDLSTTCVAPMGLDGGLAALGNPVCVPAPATDVFYSPDRANLLVMVPGNSSQPTTPRFPVLPDGTFGSPIDDVPALYFADISPSLEYFVGCNQAAFGVFGYVDAGFPLYDSRVTPTQTVKFIGCGL